MPPTINPPQNADRDRRRPAAAAAPGERRTDLVCRVKYCNTLPDIPFDPKFITYPFDSNRFIQYNATSLEKSYKYELLAEYDLGITIDLINPEAYAKEKNAHLDPADERLLEEDTHHAPQDARRKAQHAKNVSWLRRTEYISTEATRFQPMSIEKVEAKVGYSMKKALKEENAYMDHESQIKAIEKTFADAKKPILEHSTKKGVTAVEVLPVIPDFKLWKYPCAQVIFDANPAPVDRPSNIQVEEMSQAMIRGVMDETGEQFVAYFLPTSETLTKRARDASQSVDYDDNDEYDYKMARQYHWNVKSKASKGYEENYFIVFRDDAVYYNELETRVRLTKRRPKPGEPATSNTRLVLKHRSLTSREHRMFRQRERQLEPANQAEDEEEMEEDDEEIDEEEGGAAGGQRVIKDEDKEVEGKEDADSDAQSDRSRSRSRSKSKSPRSASSGGSSSRSRSSSAASSRRSASPVPVKVEDQPRDKKSSSGSGSSSSSSSASSSASSSGSSSDSE
ncbi:hypothetical protein DAPPUDRAFT_302221 [Daphnia pulex]|uniref:RNA polymerase II-associated factor 1 homolog n=1 Tax=Daphnia pulex TaxID=6669 RepID=E9HMB3_DAPPU|nr:hypothetical protein DAPPUDRAFT_302221 [Daphnia pulex]|eukprot:EFX67133.1 hypothetical protein DAPPUDRAFT_302221 [Daphnia pulex]